VESEPAVTAENANGSARFYGNGKPQGPVKSHKKTHARNGAAPVEVERLTGSIVESKGKRVLFD